MFHPAVGSFSFSITTHLYQGSLHHFLSPTYSLGAPSSSAGSLLLDNFAGFLILKDGFFNNHSIPLLAAPGCACEHKIPSAIHRVS